MQEPLPIDDSLAAVRDAVDRHGCAVVVAPPGAGKTTRVPPALIEAGPTLLLQPRRVAARALTRRIASERGWTVGREIGWQVRHEKRFGPETRLLVETEGILTARLVDDPMLSAFQTVILDEFHERSLHADLALALLRQARLARSALRVVVMSATLDAGPVADFLGAAPVIEVSGRRHPLDVTYAPGIDPAEGARRMAAEADGNVLVFLPGAAAIDSTARSLRASSCNAEIFPLHGGLSVEAQERALAHSEQRKIILATNIAETSLTVEGVHAVVDSGLHKTLRLDPGLGFDRLEIERISRDSADQRAGRAGRTGPGRALRLWDAQDHLRSHREAEIHRVDLASPLLDVFVWGEDPREFDWFEPPDADRVTASIDFLHRIGALLDGRPTPVGRAMRRLPLHPRLARVLLGARGSRESAAACAALAEGWFPDQETVATTSDLLALADRIAAAPARVRRVASELERRAKRILADLSSDALPDRERISIEAAVFAGYPDRLARRRTPGGSRLQLASGAGAELSSRSGVRGSEFVVAVELRAAKRRTLRDALVHVASSVDSDWIEATHRERAHELDTETGRVRAFERHFYEQMEFRRRNVETDAAIAAGLLRDAMIERGLGDAAEADLQRIRFAGLAFDPAERLLVACHDRDGWFAFEPIEALAWDERRELDVEAPANLEVPSGRHVRLDYVGPDEVRAAVKLQEMFGLGETPRIGKRGVPVTLLLLAPNGRPVQTTQDLRSFWTTTYAEVRKQLRGRYPKHPWPEDPWCATPTHRTRRKPD